MPSEPRYLQRLVRLRDAVADAEPMLRMIEGMLASSLSSDSRSHDQDREPRRKINAILDALDELKPNTKFSDAANDGGKTP